VLDQVSSMAAEGALKRRRIERLKEVTQGVDGRCAAHAGAKDPVEPLAMNANEHQDAAIRSRAGEHGQNREEQEMRERIASALTATRIGDLFKRG
jgi:hypothetical protein